MSGNVILKSSTFEFPHPIQTHKSLNKSY